jgi:UDP-GlcNAc:undecaprenyl-phosphate GlcNAc-1-phosphate transferase
MGGLAIGAGIALGSGGIAMMQWGDWGVAIGRAELVAFGFGVLLVFMAGVVDDLLGVSSLQKFMLELAAAILVVRAGWSFDVVSIPGDGSVHLGMFGQVVSVLWIVGVTNAINLIDGLDGLAAGVVAIISSSLLIYAVLNGNLLTVILMAATTGACLGFLRFNWSPAQIFMGDSGSLTLGFILAVMSVHSALKAPAAVAILVPLLALGVPVVDTLLVMLVRFLERPKGRFAGRFLRMFRADRQHLHYQLERLGARRARIVGWIYAVVLTFCALALVVALTRSRTLGLFLLIVEVLVIVAMRTFGLRGEAKRMALRKRTEMRAEYFGPDEAAAEDAGTP